jgi:hypothetical protein
LEVVSGILLSWRISGVPFGCNGGLSMAVTCFILAAVTRGCNNQETAHTNTWGHFWVLFPPGDLKCHDPLILFHVSQTFQHMWMKMHRITSSIDC